MDTDPASANMKHGYDILTADTAADYVRAHRDLAELVGSGPLAVRDVADGNLNSVFVVRAAPERPGLVLKQALPWVRVHGESWPLTPERAIAEERGLRVYREVAPAFTPELYAFDRGNYLLVMEDLANLKVWRDALNAGEAFPAAADAMGRLVARIAVLTSELGMDVTACRELRASSVNSDLCKITEDLVLTEPFMEHEHNWHHPGLQTLVEEIRGDDVLLGEVAILKHTFMTHGEALIHGDLHTGSVMVGDGRAVAIDPEFCFYGPVGFDLGALWANFVIAAARARVVGSPGFRSAVEGLLTNSWMAFVDEINQLWPDREDGFMGSRFLEAHLRKVFSDAVGFAGTKATRRMIGYAHVADIETLEEPARTEAAAAVLRTARRFILERSELESPIEVWSVVEQELSALGTGSGA